MSGAPCKRCPRGGRLELVMFSRDGAAVTRTYECDRCRRGVTVTSEGAQGKGPRKQPQARR